MIDLGERRRNLHLNPIALIGRNREPAAFASSRRSPWLRRDGAAVRARITAKPIRLIVSFPAGSSDVLAGLGSTRRSATASVENVPVRTAQSAHARSKSAPDGYTIALGATTTSPSPHLNSSSPTIAQDFEPIRLFAPCPSCWW